MTQNASGAYDYGLWPMMIIMSAIFIVFAFSFTRPKTWRDWRAFGTFTAFVVALFTEMYGFPLTIYLLSGWLGSRYPNLELFSHDSGHLGQTLLGIGGDSPWAAHFNVLHMASNVLIALGVILIMNAWRVLYRAQRDERLATSGPYARIRHPQYVGFVAVLLGFLLQWPTIPTLAMFPVLVWMYARLSRIEEREVRDRLGAVYDEYAEITPRFIPRRDGLRFRDKRSTGESEEPMTAPDAFQRHVPEPQSIRDPQDHEPERFKPQRSSRWRRCSPGTSP